MSKLFALHRIEDAQRCSEDEKYREKLYEELLINTECQQKTANETIFIEPKESVNEQLESDVLEASKSFNLPDTKDIKQLLASLINTYKVDER